MSKKDEIKNMVADRVGNATAEPVVTNEGAYWEGEEPKATDRKEYSQKELNQYAENFNTAGRKGAKMPRICLAVTPTHYDYIRTMARASCQTIAQYCYGIIEDAYQKNKDDYKKILELRSEYWRAKFEND